MTLMNIYSHFDKLNKLILEKECGWVPINWSIANETIFQQKEGKSS